MVHCFFRIRFCLLLKKIVIITLSWVLVVQQVLRHIVIVVQEF